MFEAYPSFLYKNFSSFILNDGNHIVGTHHFLGNRYLSFIELKKKSFMFMI